MVDQSVVKVDGRGAAILLGIDPDGIDPVVLHDLPDPVLAWKTHQIADLLLFHPGPDVGECVHRHETSCPRVLQMLTGNGVRRIDGQCGVVEIDGSIVARQHVRILVGDGHLLLRVELRGARIASTVVVLPNLVQEAHQNRLDLLVDLQEDFDLLLPRGGRGKDGSRLAQCLQPLMVGLEKSPFPFVRDGGRSGGGTGRSGKRQQEESDKRAGAHGSRQRTMDNGQLIMRSTNSTGVVNYQVSTLHYPLSRRSSIMPMTSFSVAAPNSVRI